jgi:acetylxylan esterase
MSIRFHHRASAFLPLATMMLAASPCRAGSWQNTAPFGAALKGDLYTPSKPGVAPAILVVIHMCSGKSTTVHSWFETAAESNGFYLIAPDAGKNCFDSSISRSATSDPGAIVTMVNYVLAHTTADKSRVFATGMSSGGCMTNTLLAAFPDVFAGGSAMPGFPAGLWPAGDTQCQKCSSTPGTADTGQKYASMATSAFAFSGTRPCVEQWVGGGDQYNFNGWLPVVASQFQILGNLGAESAGTGGLSGWTRKVYKDTAGNVRLETNLGPSSQRHDLETVGASLYSAVVTFLGLDQPTGACGLTTSAGGASSTGGASSVAGSSGTGGTKATGGAFSFTVGGTSANAGGTKTTGGAAAGGAAAGGVSAAAGASATGGTKAAGGASAAGGKSAMGGAVGNTGGASSSTTNAVTGGNGTTNTTEAAQTGGNSAATTNQAATGGSSNAGEGGNQALGGASVIGSAPGATTDQGGCGCRVAGKSSASGRLWGLGLLGVAFAAGRRRRRRVS